MTLSDQWHKIKENWLITVLIVLVVGFVFFSDGNSGTLMGGLQQKMGVAPYGADMGIAESTIARGGYYPSPIPPYDGEDFAPEVKDRKITKNAYLSSEVDRGSFWDADSKIKSIITSTDSFLLNENTYKSGPVGRKSYFTGSYQIRVESKKYDAVISQLREIGEIQSFSENVIDITGQYTSLEDQIADEKLKLAKYKSLVDQAQTVDEKLKLMDRIIQQERTIKYLEDSLKNTDTQVSYSTISINIQEKQSEYADAAIVKISELVKRLLNSINGVLRLVFWILPYALVAGLIWWIVRKVKKPAEKEIKKK